MKIVNEWKTIPFEKIVELYNAVGWSAYTDDLVSLENAFENTSLVQLALSDEGDLMGLTRSISDGVAIHYLQDIIVHPDHQRKGLGRKLLESALDTYKNVRTHMILTDDEEKQLKFYGSLGYKNTKELVEWPLNAFVRMDKVDLK